MTAVTNFDFTQDELIFEIEKENRFINIKIHNWDDDFANEGLGRLDINFSESQVEKLAEKLFEFLYVDPSYKELEERNAVLESRVEELEAAYNAKSEECFNLKYGR